MFKINTAFFFWGGFFWFVRSIPLFLHGVVQALGRWTGQRDVVVKVGEATDTIVPTKQVHIQKIFRWWFQIFSIFTPVWGRFPFWLIFFKGVETTNEVWCLRYQRLFLPQALDLDDFVKMDLDIHSILAAGSVSKATAKDDIMAVLASRMSDWTYHPRYATATLSALGKKRRPDLVELVLQCMEDVRVDTNVFHYSVAITASEKTGDWPLALHFLATMHEMSIEANEYSYSAAISALEKGGEWQLALWLLRQMCDHQLFPNEVTYGASITSCARGGNWIAALGLLVELLDRGLQLNVIATSAAITACEKASQWQAAINLLKLMDKKMVDPDCICFSSAISACEKSGCWELALALLQGMHDSFLTPDTGTFNAGISACAVGGQWQMACDLLFAMPGLHVAPDMISFSAAIVACDKCERWTLALCLLQQSLLKSIRTDTVFLNSVLHSLESTNNWRTSLALLRDMASQDVLLNELSYRAVMGACQWLMAIALWEEMCQVTGPSTISASTCILVCAKQDEWQAGLQLLQYMLEEIGFPEGPSAFDALIHACDRKGCDSAANQLLTQWNFKVTDLLGSYSTSGGWPLPTHPQPKKATTCGPAVACVCPKMSVQNVGSWILYFYI